jgi:hypothetical protein
MSRPDEDSPEHVHRSIEICIFVFQELKLSLVDNPDPEHPTSYPINFRPRRTTIESLEACTSGSTENHLARARPTKEVPARVDATTLSSNGHPYLCLRQPHQAGRWQRRHDDRLRCPNGKDREVFHNALRQALRNAGVWRRRTATLQRGSVQPTQQT